MESSRTEDFDDSQNIIKDIVTNSKQGENKFALLWGEAQKKIAYSYLKVT